MVDSQFNYTYEYQGNAPKLVHTPLTDKCYLTLTQAMLMGLGGNPYGPAGTGKTESVKALGGLMGRQVLVFNCDEVSFVIFKTPFKYNIIMEITSQVTVLYLSYCKHVLYVHSYSILSTLIHPYIVKAPLTLMHYGDYST